MTCTIPWQLQKVLSRTCQDVGMAVSEHGIKLRAHVPLGLDCSEQVFLGKWLSSSVLLKNGLKDNC